MSIEGVCIWRWWAVFAAHIKAGGMSTIGLKTGDEACDYSLQWLLGLFL